MRAVVVGGGIVGIASAYALASRGAEVVVLEQDSIGAGATDRAAGGVRAQFSTTVSIRLSQESIAVWERIHEESGIGYRRPGYLYVARTDETADRFRETVPFQNEHGVESRVLTPQEAEGYVPELNAERYAAAAYCPTDGFADPHLGLQALVARAREAGAEIRTGVAVTDILDPDGVVAGVDTDNGRLNADFVVNAAGAWSPRVASMAGIDLPVSPRRRQALIAVPARPVPEDVPLVTDLDAGCYFRPERDGRALVGGHFGSDPEQDPDDYRESTDLDWTTDVLETVGEVAEYFGDDTSVVRGWAGLYSMTPDHHPIIEESKPGLITATGFSGHGFMQSPATGQVVSELVLDGEPLTVDVSPLRRDRFDRGEQLEETYYSA